MRYRLSTLLIIVAGIAVAFTQHASPVRFTIVATVELALAMVWIAAKGYPFPWRLSFAFLPLVDLGLVVASFWSHGSSGQESSLIEVVLFLVVFVLNAILLMILVGLLFFIHSMADAYFGGDRDGLRSSPGTETRKSSD